MNEKPACMLLLKSFEQKEINILFISALTALL